MILEHESVKILYKQRLDEELGHAHHNTPEDLYNHIEESIHAAAIEALGFVKNNAKPTLYWWDEEIEDEMKIKREKYQQYLNTKREGDWTSYRNQQTRVRKKITTKKNESWEQECLRIDSYIGEKRATESWKIMKSIRKNRKKDLITPITLKNWDSYFNELLTEKRAELEIEDSSPYVRMQAFPTRISRKEVKDICLSLRNGRAPGPGGIPAELIKNGTEKLYEELKTLFQYCISGQDIPKEFGISFISTIYKSGNKNDCNN